MAKATSKQLHIPTQANSTVGPEMGKNLGLIRLHLGLKNAKVVMMGLNAVVPRLMKKVEKKGVKV